MHAGNQHAKACRPLLFGNLYRGSRDLEACSFASWPLGTPLVLGLPPCSSARPWLPLHHGLCCSTGLCAACSPCVWPSVHGHLLPRPGDRTCGGKPPGRPLGCPKPLMASSALACRAQTAFFLRKMSVLFQPLILIHWWHWNIFSPRGFCRWLSWS